MLQMLASLWSRSEATLLDAAEGITRGTEATRVAEVGLVLPAFAPDPGTAFRGGVGVAEARGRGGLDAVARGSVPVMLGQLEAARELLDPLDGAKACGSS